MIRRAKLLKLDKTNYVTWWRDKKLSEALATNRDNLSHSLKQSSVSIGLLTPLDELSLGAFIKTMRSVFKQTHTNWQWYLIPNRKTNSSLKMLLMLLSLHPKVHRTQPQLSSKSAQANNIASEKSMCDYLGFLNHGDELTEDALLKVAAVIDKTGADFIYSDEDVVDSNGFYENPHFKTDFNYDLLLSHYYIGHLFVVKKSIFDRLGGFDCEFESVKHHDFVLRLSEVTQNIVHISDVLYHQSKDNIIVNMNDVNDNCNANDISGTSSIKLKVDKQKLFHHESKRVLQKTITRLGIDANVLDGNLPTTFHIKRTLSHFPKVSIVIPFKDQPFLLRQVIDSIVQITDYQNYEIIGVSNNSVENDTYATMDSLKQSYQHTSSIHFFQHDIEFNFSKLVNFGVEQSKGEHIVLMNNDIQPLNSYWLEAMLVQSIRDEVGVVGAKLFYPDNTIQHAGIAMGLGKDVDGGSAGHIHQRMQYHSKGYFNRLNAIQEISAVTAAMMMVKKSIYQDLNGFDERDFSVAFNDVDFCLRAIEKGYKNIFTPYAQAYHYESVSRGHDIQGAKFERLSAEKEALRRRHKCWFEGGDPYYNRQLDYNSDDFSVSKKYEQVC